jgi:hypothetical protein
MASNDEHKYLTEEEALQQILEAMNNKVGEQVELLKAIKQRQDLKMLREKRKKGGS